MTDTLKIKKDFLKLLGNDNPSNEDLKKLEPIPDSQLLKPIVSDCKKRGVSLRMIAIRYNITIDSIEKISQRSKQE